MRLLSQSVISSMGARRLLKSWVSSSSYNIQYWPSQRQLYAGA